MIENYRIHIVGSGPRTGTTLLHEIMKTCYEFDFASKHEDSINRSNKQIGSNYSSILTKQPSELYGIEYPLMVDKNLFVICMIRDPRDMVCSFHGRYPNEYWASLRYWKQFLHCYKALYNHSRIIYIRYEDLTRNPDYIQDKINKKFPFLVGKYKFKEYHKFADPSQDSNYALKHIRPIESTGIGNWTKHLDRIKHQIVIHGNITKSLMEFNYESDDSWTEMLPHNYNKYKTKTKEFFGKKELHSRKVKMIKAAIKIILDRYHVKY